MAGSDITLNRYLIWGTDAERLAFTPNPTDQTVVGPGISTNVLWTVSDVAGNPTYAWDIGGSAWVAIGGGSGSITRAITFAIDGGGSTITTGIKADVFVPFACTISEVTMLADQTGSIVVDIWKAAYSAYPPTIANTITASALPTISAGIKSQDATLTGWTTSVSAGDTLRFNVNSCSAITRLNLTLKVS